jgi:hypothetical protein
MPFFIKATQAQSLITLHLQESYNRLTRAPPHRSAKPAPSFRIHYHLGREEHMVIMRAKRSTGTMLGRPPSVVPLSLLAVGHPAEHKAPRCARSPESLAAEWRPLREAAGQITRELTHARAACPG